MFSPTSRSAGALLLTVAAASALAGCSSKSGSSSPAAATTAATSAGVTSAAAASGAAGGGCSSVVATAKTAVQAATDTKAPWTGPTTGPKAATGKNIVYVAQTLTNPGVAGNAKGVQEAAAAIGWTVTRHRRPGRPGRHLGRHGPGHRAEAGRHRHRRLRPRIGDAQVKQANDANIPLIGWHALGTPVPAPAPSSSAT